MDQNTFELGLAAIAMIQTVALAYIAVVARQTQGTVTTVHDTVSGIDAKTPPAVPTTGGVAKG